MAKGHGGTRFKASKGSEEKDATAGMWRGVVHLFVCPMIIPRPEENFIHCHLFILNMIPKFSIPIPNVDPKQLISFLRSFPTCK